MKYRIIVALLLALLLYCAVGAQAEAPETGAVVMFGSYEQDNQPDNGAEPIEWLVFAQSEGKALLVSRYALDCQPYNAGKADVSWSESSLREWLNGEFLHAAFTDEERSAIVKTAVGNREEANGEWATDAGAETQDSVFLLSYAQAIRYFEPEEIRKLAGTPYAREQGARFLGITSIGIGETDWWLRSPGKDQDEACYVDVRGSLGSRSVSDKLGIRPALLLDMGVSRADFPYERAVQAAELEAAGQYAGAADLYEALGAYNDSVMRAKQCRYRQALLHQEAQEYEEALKLFDALGDYEDSEEQGRACRYAIALACQEAGDYKTAVKVYEKLGQYRDSMTQLKGCFDKLGISMYYFGAEAVDAGVDTGYAKSNTITGKDRHFGWRMGRFLMSGFTRVVDGGTDTPIFIKTLGDSVTLWFELEQDIDALNGNDKLVVSDDVNGFSQDFGVSKTDFGRGTLVIRHTDYQNRKGEPQVYTDYLLASGTSGANTRVVLNEEGDYEAALYYEVEDNDLKHIASKYGNYRITFRFSVRNGNCMVYPFDLVTGAELQNTSVTENGFRLDLARSRYLDIDVKRSVLVDSPTGVVEDERFNRPAKDGDRYEAEGIYTISVSNRYTGESTVKTIFVGTDALLQEYIAKGFSPDRLK